MVINEKASFETQVRFFKSEVEAYKQLNDKLKDKIRSMGTGYKDNKDFLDTFEEVMREEMMTMKSAFEMKLKNAKEDAENISRRHRQEIQRLQSVTPSVR